MTRIPNQFFDPVTATTYNWAINESDQDGPRHGGNVDFDGKASSIGVIGTQGEDQALLITLTGTILTQDQYRKFLFFSKIKNSFRFIDSIGNQYEVSMTEFSPKVERVAMNYMDPTYMPHHKYTYTMQLWVLRTLAGDLFSQGIRA